MTRRPLLAVPLGLFLIPGAAAAQEGPSFNCDYASTRSEIAICASPELARIERAMVQSYERLAAVIGEREARAIADELLARRQACEDDIQCNAERLLIALEVFEQRAGSGGGTEFARLDDILSGEVAAPAPAPEEPEVAALPEPELPVVPEPQAELPVATAEPAPEIPLAAQAPLLPDVIPIPPSREVADAALPDPSPEPDLREALEGAEFASSDGAAASAEVAVAPEAQASFDTPLSWAFMDLEREERADLQERLASAGFFQGEASGTWTNATLAALENFAAEEDSGSFDVTTQTGAALLLDYVSSDAFASAFGTGGDTVEAAAVPPTPVGEGSTLDATEW
jgi:hypothetical protein